MQAVQKILAKRRARGVGKLDTIQEVILDEMSMANEEMPEMNNGQLIAFVSKVQTKINEQKVLSCYVETPLKPPAENKYVKRSKDNQQDNAILRGETDIDPFEYMLEKNEAKKKFGGTKEEEKKQASSNKFTKKVSEDSIQSLINE